MLDSYFFIPGDKTKYLAKIGKYDADYFVIDLEESVSENNKMKAYENIEKLLLGDNVFVRLPIEEKIFSEEQILHLVRRFGGRIIFPKIKDISTFGKFVEKYKDETALNIIVLIENAFSFVKLPDILEIYSKFIHAIGFGSHDFCSIMGMKHTSTHLDHYRKQLILFAKAYDVKYLDGVDLNIRDLSVFEQECKFLFEAGGNGKFIIHPNQLKRMYEIEYLSKQEYEKMLAVLDKLSEINFQDFDVIEIDGEVYEKPHLLKMRRLVKRYSK